MAAHYLRAESALINTIRIGGGLHINVPVFLERLSRHQLEVLVDRAIALLDAQDGDCDLEQDDAAGIRDEDGVNSWMIWHRRAAGSVGEVAHV